MVRTQRNRSADLVKENFWKMAEKDSRIFYKDMRFWLVLLLLTAFLVFTLIKFPA